MAKRIAVQYDRDEIMVKPPPEDTAPSSDGGALKPTAQPASVPRPALASRSGVFVVVPLVMIAAAIAGLVLTGMKDSAIYSKSVDQLLAERAKFIGRPVRAEGNLVHGTLTKRDSPCEYRFTITKNGADVPVRYAQCIVPDTFRDVAGMDVGVTVEGELHADNTFEATTVLAKCPSKYEMKDRKAGGEAMPHGLSEAPRETM